MRWSLPFLLSLLPLRGLAGKNRNLRSRQCKQQSTFNSTITTANQNGGPYTLVDYYNGTNFLDEWTFVTDPDLSGGKVNYISRDEAVRRNLAFVRDDVFVMSADDVSQLSAGQNRDSVRIGSPNVYGGGLFILDLMRMPYGCGVWPAYWSYGPNWPSGGEIDVLEGVNNGPTNHMTLHTSGGCTISQAVQGSVEGTAVDGTMLHNSCESGDVEVNFSNDGCGFLDNSPQSYGKAFNDARGGVFAHTWDETGIKIWRFSRKSIPHDITAKTPNPSNWGHPVAYFPSTHCDMASHFFNHQLIFNIDFCGPWVDSVYGSSGCPLTCSDYVLNAGNFQDGQLRFEIVSVAVYKLA